MSQSKGGWSESFRNFALGFQAVILALHALLKLLLSAVVVALVFAVLLNSPAAMEWLGERFQGVYDLVMPRHQLTLVELKSVITNHRILELASIEKKITMEEMVSDTYTSAWLGPLGHSEFKCRFEFRVKAGFDLKKLDVTGDPRSTIVLLIPPPEIVSVESDFGEDCLVEKPGWTPFTDPAWEFFKTGYRKLKEGARNKAIHDGILEQAKVNARDSLGELVRQISGAEDVRVEFVVQDIQNPPKL